MVHVTYKLMFQLFDKPATKDPMVGLNFSMGFSIFSFSPSFDEYPTSLNLFENHRSHRHSPDLHTIYGRAHNVRPLSEK